MRNFARALFLIQQRPELVICKFIIRAGMELIEGNGFDAESAKRGVELLADMRRGEVVGPVHETIEVVAEFRGNNPARPLAAVEVITNEPFGCVITITLGSVDEV